MRTLLMHRRFPRPSIPLQAAYILLNKIDGTLVSMTPAEYAAGKAKDYKVIDVSPVPSIRGARFVELSKVNGELEGLDKEDKLLLVCVKEREAISSRTVCATMDTRIPLCWRARSF